MFGRLDKLEKDINFLSVMQDLLVPNDFKSMASNSHEDQALYALVNQQCKKLKDKLAKKNSCVQQNGQPRGYQEKDAKNTNLQQLNNATTNANCGCVSHRTKGGPQLLRQRSNTHLPQLLHTIPEEQEEAAASGDRHRRESFEALKYELQFERDKRVEIQEASTRVAVKLQKAEDELRRESKVKGALLIETLELKNHIQDYIERVQRLEFEVRSCKIEHSTCGDKMQSLNNEKQKVQEELLKATIELEKNSDALKRENRELGQKLAQIQAKFDAVECQQNRTAKEKQTTKEENQKLQFQVDQLLEKCVHLEKEKEKLLHELSDSVTRSKETDSQLRFVNDQLTKLQHQFQEQQTQHGHLLQKSQSNLSQQRKVVSTQIDQCYSLLAKTKDMLTQLQNDKLCLQQNLEHEQAENLNLVQQLKLSNTKLQSLEQFEQQNQEQLNSVVSKNMDRFNQLQVENSGLKCKLKEERDEREKMLELMSAVRIKLASDKTKFVEVQERDKVEKERLKSEVSRIQDNFNVLQKINQDNTSTIQKLRSELDTHKQQASELGQVLIEQNKNEQKLSALLNEKESLVMELEDQVDYFQNQVQAMQGEIEKHDCEDHVESVYKNKFGKLDTLLKSQKVELEARLETLRSERDQAIAAGRKSVIIAQQTRLDCDARILQITTATKQEITELEEKRQNDMISLKKKIADLELELKHARSSTNEIQRSLSNRIQQLQCVLTTTAQALCLNGSGEGSAGRTTYGTSNSSDEDGTGTIDANIRNRFNQYFTEAANGATVTNPFVYSNS